MLEQDKEEEGKVVIKGLTVGLKGGIVIFIMIPRILIAVTLLWLGCRWLAATQSFADILLNSVGLEFILLLKESLYIALAPARNKRETQATFTDVAKESNHPGPISFLGTFM